MLDRLENYLHKPTVKDLSNYFSQVATFLACGFTFSNANIRLAEMQTNKIFAGILKKINESMAHGEDIASAFNRTKFFQPVIIAMLQQSNNNLEAICRQISEYLFRSYLIRKKIIKASWQPAIGIFLISVVFLAFNAIGLPMIIDLFENVGADIPGPIIFFVNYIKPVIDKWYIVIPFLYILYKVFNKTLDKNGLLKYKLIGKIPIVKDMVKLTLHERFCSTFALMLESGLNSIEALKIMADTTEHKLAQRVLMDTVKAMRSRGLAMSVALYQADKDHVFDKMLHLYIASGEESSNLATNMRQAAKMYRVDVEQDIEMLSEKLTLYAMLPFAAFIIYLALLVYGTIFGLSSGLLNQHIR